MDIEFGESMFQCPWHPLEEVVGVCAWCLRERLNRLKGKKKLLRRGSLKIAYSSDSDSCVEFDENRIENFMVPESYAIHKREIVARKKFLWLTKFNNKSRTLGLKKEKKAIFSLRSLFHKLRKNKQEEPKQDTCISHEDSFISIRLDGNEKSPWAPSVVAVPGIVRACKTANGSSARSSVSEVNRPSWDGSLFSKRSSFFYEKETVKRDTDSYLSYDFNDSRRCSDYQQQDMMMSSGQSYTFTEASKTNNNDDDTTITTATAATTVRWRTRMNALFQMKWRMQESKASKRIFKESNNNNYHNPYPTSKIWSLSALYNNNYHEPNDRHNMRSTSTKRANKKSWIRNLTSPKWSLH